MDPFSWTCPFCDRATTINDTDAEEGRYSFDLVESKTGYHILEYQRIVCPNPDCKEFSLSATVWEASLSSLGNAFKRSTEPLHSWRLVPTSKARPMPDYVPQAIIEDYQESCLIQSLSPKASATLSRRALQGMIRDFWGVTGKGNLKQEIDAIEERVDSDTWQAIESVRKIGNIGAHMEQDINLIIDVTPEEADALIWLTESLVEDWYIQRNERATRLAEITEIAVQKKLAQQGEKSA